MSGSMWVSCISPASHHPAYSQDEDGGGISDRPEDQVDVYHTFFGIAGLALMGCPHLQPIDPTFALPVEVVQRLRAQRQALPALEVPAVNS
jgi:hypothetical protein